MKKEPSQLDIDIGNRIRQLRKHLEISGTVIAEKLHVSRGAVGNWERGQGIKRENLQKIAAEFRISFDWLASGRGSMTARPDLSLPEGLKQKMADLDLEEIEEAFEDMEALIDKRIERRERAN